MSLSERLRSLCLWHSSISRLAHVGVEMIVVRPLDREPVDVASTGEMKFDLMALSLVVLSIGENPILVVNEHDCRSIEEVERRILDHGQRRVEVPLSDEMSQRRLGIVRPVMAIGLLCVQSTVLYHSMRVLSAL